MWYSARVRPACRDGGQAGTESFGVPVGSFARGRLRRFPKTRDSPFIVCICMGVTQTVKRAERRKE
jgi:hypothetical protein